MAAIIPTLLNASQNTCKYLEVSVIPWKINMEPTNQPFRKKNDLPNLHDYVPW